MFEFMSITKALSDENRVRILMALNRQEELCVCHLIDLLGLAPSTVSKHLSLLRNARLIVGRKDGRWMHYRLNRREASHSVVEALDWVAKSISKDAVIQLDAERLDGMLAGSPAALCRS